MSHDYPRAILRNDRVLILVPEALRVVTSQTYGSKTADVELHLSREDYDAFVRQMPGEIHDFLRWIISLDDSDPESQGFQDRRTTTMTEIIRRAQRALGEEEKQ